MTTLPWALVGLTALVALWILRQLVGSLLGQELRGSIPEVVDRMARRAADLLLDEDRDRYRSTWLAELEMLRDKPLSALLFARGLRRAARTIAQPRASSQPDRRPAALASRIFEIGWSVLFFVLIAPILGLSLLLLRREMLRAPRFMAQSQGRPRLITRQRVWGEHGVPFYLFGIETEIWVRSFNEDGSAVVRMRVGRVLHATGLDALPCVLNVLRGEMGLIGPPPVQAPLGSDATSKQAEHVKPGLVSWQELQRRGALDLTAEDAKAHDRNRTLTRDARLLALVAYAIVRRC